MALGRDFRSGDATNFFRIECHNSLFSLVSSDFLTGSSGFCVRPSLKAETLGPANVLGRLGEEPWRDDAGEWPPHPIGGRRQIGRHGGDPRLAKIIDGNFAFARMICSVGSKILSSQ